MFAGPVEVGDIAQRAECHCRYGNNALSRGLVPDFNRLRWFPGTKGGPSGPARVLLLIAPAAFKLNISEIFVEIYR